MSQHETTARPRRASGRYAPIFCTDPNCCGPLRFMPGKWGRWGWRCDGLTFADESGPLVACERTADDAE